MQVWNVVTDCPHVDVLGIHDLFQQARYLTASSAEGSCFVVLELAETANMALWLQDEMTTVRRGPGNRVDVTYVDMVVFKEHPTFGLVSQAMLPTDEATRCIGPHIPSFAAVS